eukprot:gnl/MRDRNA2_/MRDRNA2_128498_c0_seq1.p1 gnl/MRDRNA2_/MRDRNA2_128498_c0~~gnl/MRDRNA2_/MRDRNA2_128498_c0_seq1.p1  ORF type:complete len:660 (+),score=154.83 gnl/MRDRNA2_/MRDRNA2_128498_c0_seq1:85-2064(+)
MLSRAPHIVGRGSRNKVLSFSCFEPRRAFAVAPEFRFKPLFDIYANPVDTKYRKLTSDGVTSIDAGGEKLIKVEGEVLSMLSAAAINDIQHLYRPAHLQQLSNILQDPEASENDRFVATELLKNACVSAGRIMPSCQDTGTAAIMGNRGGMVLTDGRDEEHLSKGVYDAYTKGYLRYSQVAPLTMFDETNTRTNLPAQIDIMGKPGAKYDFLFVAKGGGSANKTQLLQKTKAVLNEKAFEEFIMEQIVKLGTAACPPYHLAIVVGGLSAEQCLKTVKLASCKYLDSLPYKGNKHGQAFRDIEWEQKLTTLAQNLGIGAQYGGKYFLHDVRVVRLPRHGASCPVAIGVSCSADRQALAKITEEGVFLEQLEEEPAKYLPDVQQGELDKEGEIVQIDLSQPMPDILKTLDRYPVKTRLSLTGTIIVARDIAHARLQSMIDEGKELPEYFTKYPVYYAGPAKTPAGMPSGSFGPTTAGRMDLYVDSFQQRGGSMIMIGKGNRSSSVTAACKKYGGFYLGSIGGVAATLSSHSIKKVQVLDMEELGMEAVWRIDVENFPAFIVVDNKGNDFFEKWQPEGQTDVAHDSFFDEAADLFYGIDTDGNGDIDVNELSRGLGIAIEDAQKIMDRFDVDRSGGIDMKEFELLLIKEGDYIRQLRGDDHH